MHRFAKRTANALIEPRQDSKRSDGEGAACAKDAEDRGRR